MNNTRKTLLRRQRGVTLIELMVAMVIGLVVVLAATNILVLGESSKRTTTGNNDVSQTGSYTAYTLDRVLRSAGSGFAQGWDQGVFGCQLNASRVIGGTPTTLLPRTGAFPAPFQQFLGGAGAGLAGNLRVAPVLIGDGQSAGGSDVLMVMSGNASAGDAARKILSAPTTTSLRLVNTVGLSNGDMGLVTQPGSTECLLEQVDTATPADLVATGNEVLPLGGEYRGTSGSLATMAASGNASISTLGNVTARNIQFQLIGVNDSRTLVAYDLLRRGAIAGDLDPVQPLADSVAEMHAIYGLDTSTPKDNIVDSWVAPTGAWAIANVMTNPALMRQIVAVRVAIVLRANNYEKGDDPAVGVTTGRPALFAGTPGAIAATTFAAGDENRHFRLRVIDTTIPLRNMLLLPAS